MIFFQKKNYRYFLVLISLNLLFTGYLFSPFYSQATFSPYIPTFAFILPVFYINIFYSFDTILIRQSKAWLSLLKLPQSIFMLCLSIYPYLCCLIVIFPSIPAPFSLIYSISSVVQLILLSTILLVLKKNYDTRYTVTNEFTSYIVCTLTVACQLTFIEAIPEFSSVPLFWVYTFLLGPIVLLTGPLFYYYIQGKDNI